MNIARLPVPVVLLLAFAWGGCVEKEGRLSEAERARAADLVTTSAPTPQHALRARFGDHLELIGYDVDAEAWTTGQTLRVTWYWRVIRPVDAGWRVFTHIADDSGATQANVDDAGETRRLLPPERWPAGSYVRDVQELPLPPGWSAPHATFYLGLWKDDARLEVTEGPNDGERRVPALTLPTPLERRPPPRVPSLHVPIVSIPPSIDGKLDEASWRGATPTAAFVSTIDGRRASFVASARALWDATHLYIGFDVHDDFLKATHDAHDDHLWEEDCVEIMVDPDGDGRNYFEIQVSPRGVTFDTRYDSRRVPRPYGHVDWESELRAAVDVRGAIDGDDGDDGYTVEVAIPFAAFAAGHPPAPPARDGVEWRANFYVMDSRERGQRAAGWSPPLVGDFHVPARFGRLLFFDPSVGAPPSASD